MKHAAVMLLTTLLAGSGLAAADTQYIVPGEGDSVQEDSAAVMLPQRPHDVVKFIGQQHVLSGESKLHQFTTVNSHVVYLNNCAAGGGCHVTPGNDDSTTNTSSIPNSPGTLAPFNGGASEWSTIVSCMQATMSRFNITVTDVDPGTAPHFEIMIAGSASQLGQPFGVGGIAPVPCQAIGQCDPYLPNALVFAFANESFYQGQPLEICSTAAQEIAHAWILDHVVDKTDPMTYNNYSGMRQYKDGMSCGSDCQGGQSPFGSTCSGSGGTATHACMSNGVVTQNDVQMILALFGPSGAIAPQLAITSPANGATVSTGFKVDATCDSADGITEVDLLVDDVTIAALHAAPYEFTTSPSLATGSHKITVTCSTTKLAQSTATANVTVGAGCTTAAMCPAMTDICFNGACVAGMGATGGLGATCGSNPDCTSTMCASDGTNSFCVIGCSLTDTTSCPTGYSCVSAGPTGGVCFPGGGDGSGGGGCLSATSGQGPFFLVLGGLVAMITRRRKRS